MIKLKLIEKKYAFFNALTLKLFDESNQFSFKAGQYLTLILKDSSELLSKSFSIASSPDELPVIELSFKLADDNFFLKILEMQIGDYLYSLPPMGEMIADKPDGKIYIFISMGSGVTPFRSMIKQMLSDNINSHIHLIQTNSTKEKSFYLQDFVEFQNKHSNFNNVNILTRENAGDTLRLNCDWLADYITKSKISIDKTEFFISGSNHFVKSFLKCLLGKQIPANKIHIEKYDYNFVKSEAEKVFLKIKKLS